MKRAYVGFGANLGDPAATLRAAAAELGRRAGAVAAGSRIYRSRPIGLIDQPEFLNAVARLDTTFSAERLLESCSPSRPSSAGCETCDGGRARSIST